MNAQKPVASQRQIAENKYKLARSNLLLMLIFSALNIALLFTESNMMWMFSATIPYYAVIFGIISEDMAFLTVNLVIAAICLLAYLVCWICSKKRYGFMIAALAMFAMDTLALLGLALLAGEISGVLDIACHAWVLYYLIIGVKYGRQMKTLPEEVVEAEMATPLEGSGPFDGQTLN